MLKRRQGKIAQNLQVLYVSAEVVSRNLWKGKESFDWTEKVRWQERKHRLLVILSPLLKFKACQEQLSPLYWERVRRTHLLRFKKKFLMTKKRSQQGGEGGKDPPI